MAILLSSTITAAAILAFGLHQIAGLPSNYRTIGDTIYNQFKDMIELQQKLAESKLNFTLTHLENTFATEPTDSRINTSLVQCYEDAVETYPDADPTCVQDVADELQGIIYDSVQEMKFCGNLSHGWLVAHGLLPAAEAVTTGLDTVVQEILTAAQLCVKRYPHRPSKEYNCMLQAQQSYSDAWQNATIYINRDFNEMSGIGLQVAANVQDCKGYEEDTLTDKCTNITNDVQACTNVKVKH